MISLLRKKIRSRWQRRESAGSVRAVRPWLDSAREKLAASVGDDLSLYELGEKDVTDLLELARVAAHESGDRTNAPLISYLVGLAHGCHPEQSLAALVEQTIRPRA